ncbi:Sec-independent protein translocase protein TatB [Algirhabdus cladophorae]|uniref:Sec-independent protein translocase protein TatB n=1 Tax=Algirhabdus cladophorae TaxID=3377108 RepID=UPI003B84AF6E
MFGLGWGELMVVGVVALIVVGPKDLPVMFRTLGRFTGKAKGMAREFSKAMDQAADSAGVKDVAKDLNNIANPRNMGLDKLNDAATAFENWDPAGRSEEKHHTSQKAMGAETAKLAQERAEASRKIHQKTAEAEAGKRAREARAALDKAEAELAEVTAKSADTKPAEPKADGA